MQARVTESIFQGGNRPVRLVYCVLAASLFLGNCSAWQVSPAESTRRGKAALRSGEYAEAREHFEAALKTPPRVEESEAGLLEVLRITGEYREAEKRGDEFLAARRDSALLHLERARSAAARGNYAGAEGHLRRSVALGGPARMDAVVELAGLLEGVGRKRDAGLLWEQLIGEYRQGRVKGSQALGNVAVAAWRLGYVRDAKDIFLDATDAKAGEVSLEALADFGYLFLEKYNATDAMDVFKDCLNINRKYPPALLGMALAKQYENSAEVEAFARAALEVNPNFVPAVNLLAAMRMQDEDYEGALQEIRRALAVNPSDLEALSHEAICHQFRGDAEGFARVEQKVLGINPSYGRFYHTVAENFVMRRKYQEAVDFNRKAVSLDPELWSAHNSLGMNLTRVGDLAGGRIAIQKAFDGDPFNVWAFNTLELLDQMSGFTLDESEHFIFRMAEEDAPVLAPYAQKLAEEVYAKLTRRYGFIPKGPLQIEFFPDHGGFAVRTLGLPGLGALGVCFGKVVALDSPRARSAGTFNWGSTLWHEFAHVITLQMTSHNIPRWYSEGLSVYEEHQARPGWGQGLSAAFVKAYKEGKLLKVSELNAGMMRPKSPEQIGFSYYQAALVCYLIEERFGFDKIKQTLNLFAQNKPAAEVFREALGWDMATLDREYARFLDARLGGIASHLNFRRPDQGAPDKEALAAALEKDPDDFFANLHMGALLRRENANREAETHLKRAQRVFPQFTEAGNPYEILAEMYLEQKREDDALAEYRAWAGHNEEVSVPYLRAANIYRNRKDWAAAARMLEQSIYINPYDQSVVALLGEAALEAEDWPAAVAAYQVLVGLNPLDPAGTHYNLARAWLGSGKKREARRATLRALEIAPSFEEAQQLLLKIAGGSP